ncbi:beta-1,6-galactofuranosyltransferase, partial [Lactobacillus salivarius]|nr:beta-1,6-galactofuranosyltransferase [Ligilactobacillus salivarius]
NKLGIVVDNLSQIKPILDKMTKEEYQEIKSNTIKIAHKLRSGFYIKKAISELEVID